MLEETCERLLLNWQIQELKLKLACKWQHLVSCNILKLKEENHCLCLSRHLFYIKDHQLSQKTTEKKQLSFRNLPLQPTSIHPSVSLAGGLVLGGTWGRGGREQDGAARSAERINLAATLIIITAAVLASLGV